MSCNVSGSHLEKKTKRNAKIITFDSTAAFTALYLDYNAEDSKCSKVCEF